MTTDNVCEVHSFAHNLYCADKKSNSFCMMKHCGFLKLKMIIVNKLAINGARQVRNLDSDQINLLSCQFFFKFMLDIALAVSASNKKNLAIRESSLIKEAFVYISGVWVRIVCMFIFSPVQIVLQYV